MNRARVRQDEQFWQVVQDLRWKLDDGSGGGLPPQEPEFDHGGGGGGWPRWATHIVAFLLGGIIWGVLLVAPPLMPMVALAAVIGFCAYAARRRWR